MRTYDSRSYSRETNWETQTLGNVNLKVNHSLHHVNTQVDELWKCHFYLFVNNTMEREKKRSRTGECYHSNQPLHCGIASVIFCCSHTVAKSPIERKQNEKLTRTHVQWYKEETVVVFIKCKSMLATESHKIIW